MKKISSFAAYTLLLSALMTACNRPVATYQKMPVEHFATQAPVTPVTQPAKVTMSAAPSEAVTAIETPSTPATSAPTTAPLKVVEKQVQELMANNSAKIASNKKLEKRMVRVQKLLAEANAEQSTTASKTVTSARKMNLVERMMIKRVDKKIQKSLAPKDAERANAITGLLRLGIIVAVIGLILALIPGISVLGVILLIVGIVLILLDLLDIA